MTQQFCLIKGPCFEFFTEFDWIKMFSCIICSQRFDQRQHLSYHMDKYHIKPYSAYRIKPYLSKPTPEEYHSTNSAKISQKMNDVPDK